MNRSDLILAHFQKKESLRISSAIYQKQLKEFFTWLSSSDEITHDTTTQLFDLQKPAHAIIRSKQNGIIAGLEELFFYINTCTKLHVASQLADGDRVSENSVFVSMEGNSAEILTHERTMLNLLGRMSGIATETHKLTKHMKDGEPFIAATRKTPWMSLDKKAVAVGGGLTHRLNLNDAIMVKDNHIGLFMKEMKLKTIEETLVGITKKLLESQKKFSEIEVANASQAQAVIDAFTRNLVQRTISPWLMSPTLALLLDNWNPKTVTTFMQHIKQNPNYAQILFEASGNITPESIASWKQTGVDILSLGSLTHSTKNLDVSLDIV